MVLVWLFSLPSSISARMCMRGVTWSMFQRFGGILSETECYKFREFMNTWMREGRESKAEKETEGRKIREILHLSPYKPGRK